MSLIVEDGSCVEYANSYVTVDEAVAYHTLFGNQSWLDASDKYESSLAAASMAVDIIWGAQYISRKATKRQGLLWPRLGFYDNNGDWTDVDEIPRCLKQAVFEMALAHVIGNGLEAVQADFDVKSKTQQVGDLSESTEYLPTTDNKQKYIKVGLILRPIIATPNYGITL